MLEPGVLRRCLCIGILVEGVVGSTTEGAHGQRVKQIHSLYKDRCYWEVLLFTLDACLSMFVSEGLIIYNIYLKLIMESCKKLYAQ